jgi:DNA-binding CsgD family transcriptional regulator
VSQPPPLVVVEGEPAATADAVAAVRADLRRAGWQVVDAAWTGDPDPARPGSGVVRLGVVTDAATASHAMLAALSGEGLLLTASADRATVDLLCEDLRRLGPVRHVVADADPPPPRLTDEQRALLRLLLDGETLGAAAARQHLSRRTADRRIAEIRRHYGVTSTAAALAAARDRDLT